MKISTLATAAAALCLIGASTASADVQLSIADGRVSLVAKDVTVRQILAEWARIGQTRIVNVDRVTGGPVTLELRNVSEQQALDTLLRSVSGYVAAPRTQAVANASQFDRIIVMPASAAPPAPRPATAAANPMYQRMGQPAVFPTPAEVPPQVTDDDEDEAPAPPVGRGPVFNAYPPPQVVNPQQMMQPAPGLVPAAPPPIVLPEQDGGAPPAQGYRPAIPFGGAVPGMIVPQQPTAAQPNQPQVQQPKRPGPGEPDGSVDRF